MRTDTPVTIHREHYQAPAWLIPRTELHVELDPVATRITARLHLVQQRKEALILDGVGLQLEAVLLDDRALTSEQYELTDLHLQIHELPSHCVVTTICIVNPDANTALEGLYRSSGIYCTQCEAEGFRKITWFLDRPDVLSVFDVTIDADPGSCPVLLSNGNPISGPAAIAGDDKGRHRAHWHDPHPKPSYLFALVAGDLASIEDRFTTVSGREVTLQILVESHNIDRCDFAMASLKNSMRWDEQVYGLEYDLDLFMIVAVDDFNMGAMENKGLNVFNSKYVLADSETATDSDFLGVESVVAHEYFHNWTGNRVTCRDWFQLSLKEGLTVFRDQCFSADMHSATIKRIEDVRLLRARQFAEDAGPMAHPIRPDSYIEINNFYTVTVYEKGAEVIRMLHTLLGPEQWRLGMDVYFQRHDGTAATCDDFVDAMQSVTELDLDIFRRWYATAGTPVVELDEQFDESTGRYVLTVRQSVPDTPGQTDKPALHIPLRIALFDRTGKTVIPEDGSETVLHVTKKEQAFAFDKLSDKPVLSALRMFSAPVKLVHTVSDEDLAFLAANDTDGFNRWEAVQRLVQKSIALEYQESNGNAGANTGCDSGSDVLVEVIASVLNEASLEADFVAEFLTLPSTLTLAEQHERVDIIALDDARTRVIQKIAGAHDQTLVRLIESAQQTAGNDRSFSAMGQRRLGNAALGLLSSLDEEIWLGTALKHFKQADNMTDSVAALAALCHTDTDERRQCLSQFHSRWANNKLVIDKWFALQALSRRASIIEDVRKLSQHKDFDLANPNRLRSLLGSFAMGNTRGFHERSGQGYTILADYVLALDKRNPQIAAGLLSPLSSWRRYAEHYQQGMRAQLERVLEADNLSPDVYELASKSI